MSDIITTILILGPWITLFHEFPYSAYKLSETMIETSPGHWVYEILGNRIRTCAL